MLGLWPIYTIKSINQYLIVRNDSRVVPRKEVVQFPDQISYLLHPMNLPVRFHVHFDVADLARHPRQPANQGRLHDIPDASPSTQQGNHSTQLKQSRRSTIDQSKLSG